MTELQEKLFQLQDKKYHDFSVKLIPTVNPDNIIGIRLPQLRQLAKEFKDTPEAQSFLNSLPHKYLDENLFHMILLSNIKDFQQAVEKLDAFLPYVDNWAVCDTNIPKAFSKNHVQLEQKALEWVKSSETYTCRFGIGIFMRQFLDDKFKPKHLELIAAVKSSEYYVNMMIAWYFATALAKQWETTVPFIEQGRLDKWTHNKAIQKSVESFRVSEEHKEYLKTFRKK